jgi:hypothetical protein
MPVNIDNIQRSNLHQRGVPFKWNGFHRALVVEAKDEKQMGRVKIRIPDLMPELGDKFTKEWCDNGLWAHPANNYLGGRNIQDTTGDRCEHEDAWYQGSCLIPPKGSWVWIFFENGEPNHPYYFGALDAGQRKVLPENQQGPEFWKKWTLLKTRMGRCIIVSDDEDDCRVEITGKKRNISNEPDGDDGSVFDIDGNMTTILIDERSGNEKVLLKDYRGNFIKMIQDDGGVNDQLHIYFKDSIHIKTDASIYIKAAESMHCDIGENIKLTAGDSIHVKASNDLKENANAIERASYTTDTRCALGAITDSSAASIDHCAASSMSCATMGDLKMSGLNANLKGNVALHLQGAAVATLKADGFVDINGAVTNVQCGAMGASDSFNFQVSVTAEDASPAEPDGERYQGPNPQGVPDPVIPIPDLLPPLPIMIPIIFGDPYDITFGNIPLQPPPVISSPSPISVTIPSPAPVTPTPIPPVIRQAGVGHMFSLHLKDIYRDKVIPLVDKSYGKFTGFYLFRDLTPSPIDNQFLDPSSISVYDNYRNPTDWIIDQDSKWWKNLDDFCKQASDYQMTLVPTLFDFCCSPYDPFLTKLSYPYQTLNWNDSIQGEYVRLVMYHIMSSGVNFIVNLGTKYYDDNPILPDNGWFRKLVMFLLNNCNVPSNKLSLTFGPDVNLYQRNPYCRYKMWTGNHAPQDEDINNEEYVDGQWGGTGRVEVYDSNNHLIDGYVKYLLDSGPNSIPCMNMWKMQEFLDHIPVGMPIDHPNIMNYIFAPHQREAMRKVLGDAVNNNGFIDFT